MDIEIRLAKVEDRAEILQLQSSSLRVLSSKDYQPEQIESLVKSQAAARFNSEVVFVAIFKNKIVGFASLVVNKYQIGAVYVDPEFSREGIGSRLIEEVENVAIEKDYKSIDVLSSLTAIKFYQKQGYKLDSNLYFLSEGKVWIPCQMLNKRLIALTPGEKTDGLIEFAPAQKNSRLIWVLAIASILVISIAIALL